MIEHELLLTSGRNDFDFRSKWAADIDEMIAPLEEAAAHGHPRQLPNLRSYEEMKARDD